MSLSDKRLEAYNRENLLKSPANQFDICTSRLLSTKLLNPVKQRFTGFILYPH